MRGRLRSLLALTTFISGLLTISVVGCGSDAGQQNPGPDVDNGFESDDPSGQSAASKSGSSSGSSGATGGADAAAAPSQTGDSNEANRVVQEADIIKVDGNRLFALSKFGGLAIVDITNPDQMKLVGRKRVDGMPFEMYVQGNKAFIMLNDFGRYVRENNSPYGRWVQSSEILALDISNAANITETSHFDVPGTISDSRMVGDIAYVVTYENGYCWGCQQNPATIVTSFNVAGAAAGSSITKSDQIAFVAPNKQYAGWQRSVSATNQRLYIGGPEWNWGGNTNYNSVIQVVDITNPTGKLAKGADVQVAGQITNRWQMDEYEGVLRVVSQYGGPWGNNSINPKVQTFTVTSASQITPLGQTELKLPKPESLRSVRFDGLRGYAITAERTDPLFTIDLSVPATPKQVGELHMDGWIFHMEPRGNRLIGFGYDSTVGSEAKLAVSLFDVSDLTKPTMLKRVSFGSGWGSLPEDQDRIHKAVRILDDQGLILVPFASYGRWWGNDCQAGQSGIQLIDYSADNLALQGIAPQYGMPRRAFVANGRLLAMSDRNVTSFDIASRSQPVKTGELDLSNPAYRLAELPNHIASVTNDWWSGEAMLSLTPKANADDAQVAGKVSLKSLAPPNQAYCNGRYGWTSWYEARIFPSGANTVIVTVPVYTYDNNDRGGMVIAASVDVSNPAKPVISGKAELKFKEHDSSENRYGWYSNGFWDGWSYYSYYGGQQGSLVGSGQAIVQHGSKLAYIEVYNESIPVTKDSRGFGTKWETKVHRRLHVADFANPAAPNVSEPIELANSFGSSPLHLYKGQILTSRWVQSDKNKDKVRFFMDRIDINGAQPQQLPSVNIPGSLLLIDEASSRLVTTDYHATRTQANDYQDCYKTSSWRGWFDHESKQCITVSRDFKLADITNATRVTLRQTLVPPSQNIAGVQIADDRIYVTRYKRYDHSANGGGGYGYDGYGNYKEPPVVEDGGLWAIGGIRAGQLSIVSQMVGDAEWPLAASGTKVALYTQGGLAIYDTSTPTPSLVSEANLRGWGYSSHVLLNQDRAICSLGDWGLQTIKY
jgi:hypothetical protein